MNSLLSYLTPSQQLQLKTRRLELKAQKREAARTVSQSLASYQDDPVRFGEEILKEHYTEDIKRVMRSVRDNPVTVVESANAVGKTHCAARLAVWWYKCFDEAQVYTAAAPPEDNLKRLLWGEIGNIPNKHPDLFKDDAVNVLSISRNPKEFLVGVTIPAAGTPAQREARFSGKHAKNLFFTLDEGDAIPTEVYKGVESCLSGGNGRLLVMYNPRTDEGPVADMKARGIPVIKLCAFDHPNVITGEDLFPGAVTRNKTLHRIHKWTVPVNMEGVAGLGRFTVPDFLVGAVGKNEDTGEPLPPLQGGERLIVHPEFAYMVLAEYPGQSLGVIYDCWLDDYDTALKEGRPPQGNVSDEADYIPNSGMVLWSIDDGYVGSLDPQTGTYTPDSHPRVILFHQIRPNGDVVCFDEYYQIREPKPERQIEKAGQRLYAPPEYVVIGPGSAALGGVLSEMSYFKRTCMANVEESIKNMRDFIAMDENGHRRYLVHPRCKHYRYEMKRYKRDELGRIVKAYDHSADAGRYLLWEGRHGFV